MGVLFVLCICRVAVGSSFSARELAVVGLGLGACGVVSNVSNKIMRVMIVWLSFAIIIWQWAQRDCMCSIRSMANGRRSSYRMVELS